MIGPCANVVVNVLSNTDAYSTVRTGHLGSILELHAATLASYSLGIVRNSRLPKPWFCNDDITTVPISLTETHNEVGSKGRVSSRGWLCATVTHARR